MSAEIELLFSSEDLKLLRPVPHMLNGIARIFETISFRWSDIGNKLFDDAQQIANISEQVAFSTAASYFVNEICNSYEQGFKKVVFFNLSEEQRQKTIQNLTKILSVYAFMRFEKNAPIGESVESLAFLGTEITLTVFALLDWARRIACAETLNRRQFMQLTSLLIALGYILTACGGNLPEEPKNISLTPVPISPETLAPLTPAQQANLQYTAMTYGIFSQIPGRNIAGIEVFGTASVRQTQIINLTLSSNDEAAIMGLPVNMRSMKNISKALPLYDVVPAVDCADARVCMPSVIKIEDFPDVFTYADAKNVRIVSSRAVGAQPTKFPDGTPYSMFITHRQSCLPGTEKCGLLDGIRVFLSDGGEEALLHHNVPKGTIEEIKRLIKMGNAGTAEEWADAGARIQAAINRHPVLIGVKGHADGTFFVRGIALPDGIIITDTGKYKTLDAIAKILHNPRPIAEALTTQKPQNIVWSFSRNFTPDSLVGAYGESPGKVFIQTLTDFTPNKALTDAEIKQVVGGGVYASGHLPNEGVITIVADSLDDLAKIEANLTLNQEKYGLTAFFENKGVLVKLITNKTGSYELMEMENKATFAKFVDLQKAAVLGRDGQLTYEIQKGGQTFRQLGLTDSVVIHLERVLQVRLNAGLISKAQFEALMKFTRGTATSIKIGAKIFEVVGLAYLMHDAITFYKDEVLGRGRMTSILMPKELNVTTGQPVTSIKIERQTLVNEHANAIREEIRALDPVWKDLSPSLVGKLLRVAFPTRGTGDGTIATFDSSEIFLLLTSSPFKEVNQYGDLTYDRFDSTNPKQTVSFVDPNGNFIRSDKESETIVASFNSEKPGKLNYWKLKVVPSNDPKVDSTFQFTFIKTVDIDTKELAKNLSALGVK